MLWTGDRGPVFMIETIARKYRSIRLSVLPGRCCSTGRPTSVLKEWCDDALDRPNDALNVSDDVSVQSSTSARQQHGTAARLTGGWPSADETVADWLGGVTDVTMTSRRLSPSSSSMPNALTRRRFDDVTRLVTHSRPIISSTSICKLLLLIHKIHVKI